MPPLNNHRTKITRKYTHYIILVLLLVASAIFGYHNRGLEGAFTSLLMCFGGYVFGIFLAERASR